MADPFLNLGHVECHRETEKALLCEFWDGAQYWVPKSQMSARSQVKHEGDEGDLVVKQWWAETSGAIEYLYKPKAPPPPAPVVDLLPTARPLYRKLILKYHPDISPRTAEMARDLNQLWQAVQTDLKKNR